MNIYDYAFAYAEEVTGKGHLLATYYLESDARDDILKRAASIAIGQTVGTWTHVPGLTEAMLKRHLGRVVAVYEVPPIELAFNLPEQKRTLIIQIAFPEINIGAQFPMLLTALLGNDVSTSAQMKLLDLQFSPEFAAQFGGPRFGVEGIRDLLGVPERPLILNVIKPNIGFSPQMGAAMFAESARGGSDIIKDDELMFDTRFNAMAERVKVYHQAANRVYEQTGHRALYCVNITDRPDRMLQHACRAIDLGVDIIMVNAVATGLGALQALAEDDDIDIPILTHYATAASLTEGTSSGMTSTLLLGKLMRLCGSDATSFNSPYSVYPLLRENYVRAGQLMRLPWYSIKPSLPVPGGGIHPASAVRIVEDLGNDVLLAVGGAIQGHPGGPTAGARAMRQAIDAIVNGVSLVEAAQEHPELHQAIERWGSAID